MENINKDSDVLRSLAYKYYAYSQNGTMDEKRHLHMAVNDLEAARPAVFLDELPWHELDHDDILRLKCRDSFLRGIECYLRREIYRYENMPGDMIIPPYVPVQKIIYDTGIGISVKEETLKTDGRNNIISHEYFDQLADENDLLKLRFPEITYDENETFRRYNMLGEIIGDIVPVKLQGLPYFGSSPWDEIAQLRGVSNLLVDLADRPDFTHKMVSKLTDISLYRLQKYEELDLFDYNPHPTALHYTPILTRALPGTQYNGDTKITRKDVWGRGAAQIFASVSKEMRDEFDIQYMIKTIGQCGLSYYGCCEPLDTMIDVIGKIPNLRKVAITPWADIDIAAEAVNTNYVLSVKPNPSVVGVSNLDEDELRKEIRKILKAVRRNNCSCDIVLKDVSTCGYNPGNLVRWEQILMDMVKR